MTTPRCPGHARHWFSYYGHPYTSAPTCRRHCGTPNPNYRPNDDPWAGGPIERKQR